MQNVPKNLSKRARNVPSQITLSTANTASSFKHGFFPCASVAVQAFNRARLRRD
jgi:hypothetical protein